MSISAIRAIDARNADLRCEWRKKRAQGFVAIDASAPLERAFLERHYTAARLAARQWMAAQDRSRDQHRHRLIPYPTLCVGA